MKRIKKYLDYTPNEEDIRFFGWKKDENGYYHEQDVYESEEEKQAANNAAWSEYWGQFSEKEITAAIL